MASMGVEPPSSVLRFGTRRRRPPSPLPPSLGPGGGSVLLGRSHHREQEAMLHHLRSAAASSPGRLPAPPEDAGVEIDEESVRAVAVSDQRTIYLVSMFIANTVEFLNSFAATCDDKLALLHRKIVKLDSSLALLEARLYSIDENNAPGHCSASQKAQQSLSDDKIFCSDVGESSRCGDS
ncbi:unnamed protein product [Urochloa humidicola]